MNANRIQRVNSLIRQELGKILLREIDLPDVLLTITQVRTSVDLEQAKVYISVISEEQTDRVLKILNKLIYSIQQELNKRLKMRPIPKIKFYKEDKTKKAARVEELLERLKKT